MATNKPQSPSQVYLLGFNTICAGLWLYVLLGTAATLIFSDDISAVYTSLEPWTRYAQTLAVAEILHAATGLIRSPVFTTFTQVFARSVQVWGVNYAFPDQTAPSIAYPAMILAWAAADAIRYSYFAVVLAGYPAPRALKWLRYSLFIILYPIGISSEWWLMLQATRNTENMPLAALYAFFLGLYLPGSVMMYSYMLKQRTKVLAR
ncbi:uncharacterized protein N7511_010409, partial [Penicillium nucicola]|uniref:uncharacterized protein n=1 Tax=Penicillium nucicola TaxID=1850975 RepID=UPI002544F754